MPIDQKNSAHQELMDEFGSLDTIQIIHYFKEVERIAILRDEDELLWAIEGDVKNIFYVIHIEGVKKLTLFNEFLTDIDSIFCTSF